VVAKGKVLLTVPRLHQLRVIEAQILEHRQARVLELRQCSADSDRG
jgi:hypothetical protein